MGQGPSNGNNSLNIFRAAWPERGTKSHENSARRGFEHRAGQFRGDRRRLGAFPWIPPSCLYDSLGLVQNIRPTTPAQIHCRHVLCAFCRFPVRDRRGSCGGRRVRSWPGEIWRWPLRWIIFDSPLHATRPDYRMSDARSPSAEFPQERKRQWTVNDR